MRLGLIHRMKIFIGTFVSLILLAYFSYTISNTYTELQNSLSLRAQSSAIIRAKSLSGPLWNLDADLVNEMLEALKSDPDFESAVVFNEKGEKYASVGEASSNTENKINASEQIFYLHDGENINIGKISLTLSKHGINIQFRNQLISGLVLYVVLIVLLMFAISRSLTLVTKPLTEITNAMILYTNGEKNIDLPIYKSKDEIGILSHSFNQMVSELNDLQRDLEEKVRLRTEELNLAKTQADSANNLKSAFLANMSHELRTPMNGVLGMIQGTLNTDLSLEQREYLEMAKTAGNSLLKIINEILDISKIESGKLDICPSRIKLSEVLTEVLNSTSLKAYEKGLEVITNLTKDVPQFIYVDPTHLRQVLTNLVGNAIKFTQQGQITINIDALSSESPPDQMRFDIEIKDSGIGISKEGVDKIFESFVQADQSTSRKFGGTGLGLSISKQLIELMGGKISVESEVGIGTSFKIELPLKIEGHTTPTANNFYDKDIFILEPNDILFNHIDRVLYPHARFIDRLTSVSAMEIELASSRRLPSESILIFSVNDSVAENISILNSLATKGVKTIALLPVHQLPFASKLIEHGISAILPKPFLPHKLIESIGIALDSSKLSKKPTLIISREHIKENETPESNNTEFLNILVADDTKINRTVVRVMLEQMGHKVTLAESGQKSIQILEHTGHFDSDRKESPFQLIIMDVQMPELDGTEATSIIRQKEKVSGRSPIPIIACTAHALKGDKEKFISAGMDDYLTKPLEPTKLKEIIRRYSTACHE